MDNIELESKYEEVLKKDVWNDEDWGIVLDCLGPSELKKDGYIVTKSIETTRNYELYKFRKEQKLLVKKIKKAKRRRRK